MSYLINQSQWTFSNKKDTMSFSRIHVHRVHIPHIYIYPDQGIENTLIQPVRRSQPVHSLLWLKFYSVDLTLRLMFCYAIQDLIHTTNRIINYCKKIHHTLYIHNIIKRHPTILELIKQLHCKECSLSSWNCLESVCHFSGQWMPYRNVLKLIKGPQP